MNEYIKKIINDNNLKSKTNVGQPLTVQEYETYYNGLTIDTTNFKNNLVIQEYVSWTVFRWEPREAFTWGKYYLVIENEPGRYETFYFDDKDVAQPITDATLQVAKDAWAKEKIKQFEVQEKITATINHFKV